MSSSSTISTPSPAAPSTTIIVVVVVAILIGSFFVVGGISYGIQRYQAHKKAMHAQQMMSDIEAQLRQSPDGTEAKVSHSLTLQKDPKKLTDVFDTCPPRPTDIEKFFNTADIIKCKSSPPSKHRRSFAVHIKRSLTARDSNISSSSSSSLESISTKGDYDPIDDVEAIKKIVAQRKAAHIQRAKENYLKAQMQFEYISQHDLLKGKKRGKACHF